MKTNYESRKKINSTSALVISRNSRQRKKLISCVTKDKYFFQWLNRFDNLLWKCISTNQLGIKQNTFFQIKTVSNSTAFKSYFLKQNVELRKFLYVQGAYSRGKKFVPGIIICSICTVKIMKLSGKIVICRTIKSLVNNIPILRLG